MKLLILGVAALALASCAHQDVGATITALSNAGCSGTLKVGAHVSTAAGVSLGAASGDLDFQGQCDPAAARPEIKNGDPTF